MTHVLLSYTYDWSVIPRSLAFFERGLMITIRIALLSVAFSLVLGLVVALVRMMPGPIGFIGFVYVQVFRALSLYIYILFIYFGLAAAFGIRFDPIQAGVVSLTLLNSAYMAEIYRAAIQAIDPGQREAARSLGLGQHWHFHQRRLSAGVEDRPPVAGQPVHRHHQGLVGGGPNRRQTSCTTPLSGSASTSARSSSTRRSEPSTW